MVGWLDRSTVERYNDKTIQQSNNRLSSCLFLRIFFLCKLRFFDYRLRLIRRHDLIVREGHRVRASAACYRFKLIHILIHLLKGDLRLYRLDSVLGFHPHNPSAPRVQTSGYIAHELIRHRYIDIHYRFEDNGPCLLHRFLECMARRYLKCDILRIDRVGLSVVNHGPHIDDREPGKDTLLERRLYPLFAAHYERPRYGASHDIIHELKSCPAVERLYAHPDLGELPGTAGLLLVPVLRVALRCYRLLVRDLGRPEIHLNAVARLHPRYHHVYVHVAHAGSYHLL